MSSYWIGFLVRFWFSFRIAGKGEREKKPLKQDPISFLVGPRNETENSLGGLRRRHHHRPRDRRPQGRPPRHSLVERRRDPVDISVVSPQLRILAAAIGLFNVDRRFSAAAGGLQGVRQRAEGAADLG